LQLLMLFVNKIMNSIRMSTLPLRGDCDPTAPLVRQDSRRSLDRRVSFRHQCACAASRSPATGDRWASQGGLPSYATGQPIEKTIVRSYSIDKLREETDRRYLFTSKIT
jgi:hypothetical protein